MTEKKKFFCIMMIAMLCILAGCGGCDDSGGSRTESSENSGQENKPEETGTENSEQENEKTEEAGTEDLKTPAKVSFKTISFEDNYLETVQRIELTDHISYEDFDELLGVWENELYYISYKERGLLIYKVNFVEEGAESEIIYSIDEGSLWYYRSMLKDKIYLLVLTEGRGFPFRIDEIGLDGQVKEIYSVRDSLYAPIVYDLPGHLIVNYRTDEHCIMEAVSFDDYLVKQIDKRELARDEKGNMSGDYILYGGGVEPDGFYYEVVSLKHERLDPGGSAVIYYYDFETESAEMVLAPSDKSDFLSGGRDYIVRCIYAYESPLNVSGEFYQRQGDELSGCKIYELSTTKDLLWLKELKDGCAIGYTADGRLLIFDVNMMQKSDYSIPKEGVRRSNVVLMDEKIYYALCDKENIFLYIMVLK